MRDLKDQPILVVGLDSRGQAACSLLRRAGARVVAVDAADTAALRAAAGRLRAEGVRVELGSEAVPPGDCVLAVASPSVPAEAPLRKALAQRGLPVMGELELGFQQSRCLNVAIAGTNGKGTTAGLLERMLAAGHRQTILCGHGARPVCSVADQTRDLDYLLLQVNAFQLEDTQYFRPAVAALLNLAPDHLDHYARPADYAGACARLFLNQQVFDWAVVQAGALAQLQRLGLVPPSKIVTFSATDPDADLFLDRGLIISRLDGWSGPLLDTDQCRLRGPHNAENLMAALAVGRALHLPLETMAESAMTQPPGPHRCEPAAEAGGVLFINDSKATNVEALRCALLAARAGEAGKPNVWLIAGGRDQGQDFHAVSPEISRRVKGAFLIGEAREKIRSAWGLFTPCVLSNSLLEAVTDASKQASAGDVILLSPACSSFDQFQNYQQRGEEFCQAVNQLVGAGSKPTPI